MTEETKTEPTKTDGGKGEDGLSNADVRKHELFLKATSKLAEERDAAQAKLRAYEEAQAKAAKEAEERRLQERGEWDTLKKQYEEERDKIRTDYEQRFLLKELETAIIAEARTRDPIWMRGAIASYDTAKGADGIAEYIASLKEASPHIFEETSAPRAPGLTPPPGVKVGNSGLSTDQLRAQLNDPKTARAAARELEARYLAGKLQ